MILKLTMGDPPQHSLKAESPEHHNVITSLVRVLPSPADDPRDDVDLHPGRLLPVALLQDGVVCVTWDHGCERIITLTFTLSQLPVLCQEDVSLVQHRLDLRQLEVVLPDIY